MYLEVAAGGAADQVLDVAQVTDPAQDVSEARYVEGARQLQAFGGRDRPLGADCVTLEDESAGILEDAGLRKAPGEAVFGRSPRASRRPRSGPT